MINDEENNSLHAASGKPLSSLSAEAAYLASLEQRSEKTVAGAPGFPLWKRIFDLICILLTLPLWLPAMLLLALAIKLTSPGPVLFRQERIGFRGKPFVCLKFRSMKLGVETRSHEGLLDQIFRTGCPMTKLDSIGDPRLIPFGPLFRSSGLDELPQVFNVIRGEMSLVGPRPCTPYEFDRLQSAQRERVNAPPGLTGYWQVNGKNKTTLAQMIALDLFYAANMSLWMDVRILLKTVPTLLFQVLENLVGARSKSTANKPKAE